MSGSGAGSGPRSITFTRYRSARDKVGVPDTRSWVEWIEILTTHDHRGRACDQEGHAPEKKDECILELFKDGPCIVLGDIDAGVSHTNEAVKSIQALGLDIEKKSDEQIATMLNAIAAYEFVAYTSHRHMAKCCGGRPRLRVILPLAEPLDPKELRLIWLRLNALVGGINDPQTKNAGRLFYLPSTFDPAVAEKIYHPGKWLSPSDLPFIANFGSAPDSESMGVRAGTRKLRDILGNNRSMAKTDTLKQIFAKIIAGEPFAVEGDRHNIVLDVTLYVAQREENLPIEAFDEVFSPSLNAMGAGAPTLGEVFDAYVSGVLKTRQWKQEYAKRKEEEREQKVQQRTQEKAAEDAARRAGPKGPYTTDDVAHIAARQGWTAEDLTKRWIVQSDATFYFLGEDGAYQGPYTLTAGRSGAIEHLSRAPILINEPTADGLRRRAVTELVEDYGAVAINVVGDLSAQFSRFDVSTRTMREAVCPVRQLTPTYDREIDFWLKLLAGPQYEKLCDWLACVPDLRKLLCALYLSGKSGGGKTLLAKGLAALWTDTCNPTELDDVIADFNEPLAKCPMVLGDEEIPKSYKIKNVTTKLRSILSTTSRSLKRKYKSHADLVGAIRLILAANNESLLDSGGASTAEDLEAISQRFLYLEVGEDVQDFMKELGQQKIEKEWLFGGGIAKHVLHLAQTRTVTPGRRFWVEGDISTMHRLLMSAGYWNSMVCEWLVRYLMNPTRAEQSGSGLIRRGGGQLMVNDQAVVDCWALYLPHTTKDADTSKIGTALRALSKGKAQLRWKGRPVRYRLVDLDHLLAWSQQHNIGDEETLRAALGGELKG